MTPWYNIFLLIGPSNSGKSFFYNQVLKPQFTAIGNALKEPLRVVYLSSDEIRRQILGYDAHKMSDEMMAASPQAFKLLFDRLNMSTSYPNNAHFVVIDSTGLSEDFRNQVINLSKEKNYSLEAIVFDFKDHEDYLKHAVNDEYSYQQKRVTMDHIKRLRQDVMKTLGKKNYSEVTKFKNPQEVLDFKINPDVDSYNKHLLPQGAYTVIGDIHGCYDDLISLLLKLKVQITDGKITSVPESVGKLVLIGDLIDKGFESGKVVDFVFENQEFFTLVQGNHEHWVVAEFKKSSGLDEDFKKEYFNSFYELTPVQKDRLIQIYDKAFNFLKTNKFILTHSPCEAKFLGKFDTTSQKLMRKTPHMKGKKDFTNGSDYVKYLEEKFQYLQTESNRNHPYHVFGHKTFPRAMKWDNKIAIDSGAVYGGSLTAITIGQYGKIQFTSVKTTEKVKFSEEGILAPFCVKEEKVLSLSEFDKERINILAKNQIQFVSGTISPADKDLTTNELESLSQALNTYKNQGVKEVVLQTKHMGSRCNIYLNQNLHECKAVSRNGFLVKLDMTTIYQSLLNKFSTFMAKEKIKTMILDGELMPWSALGKGLINEQYEVVAHAVSSEVELLKTTGFETALEGVRNHPKLAEFLSDVNKLSKNKMIDKYGYQTYHTLVSLKGVKIDLTNEATHIQSYAEQVKLYGQEKPLEFLPFMLLKTIHLDGEEKVWMSPEVRTKEVYELVSDQEFAVIDLTDPNYLSKAQEFYDKVVSKGEEGIVVKPEFTFMPNVAPFIKVRNPQYLRIIYGYNYLEPEIYNGLVQSKKVGKKMRVSINEYLIAKKMLEIPVSEISADNPVYSNLIAQMIAEEQEEQKIDYRL